MRSALRFIALAAILAACSSPPPNGPPATGLRGRVVLVDSAGQHQPAPGAVVALAGSALHVKAAADGTFALTPPAGQGALLVTFDSVTTGRPDFGLRTIVIDLAPRDLGDLVVGKLATIDGHVTRGGKPVSGATVLAPGALPVETDTAGHYALTDLVPAAEGRKIEVTAFLTTTEGTRGVRASTALPAGVTTTLDLVLPDEVLGKGTVSGSVRVLGNGKTALTVDATGDTVQHAEVNDDGRFDLADLPGGVYGIVVGGTGLAKATVSPVLVGAGPVTLEALTLVPATATCGGEIAADADKDGFGDACDVCPKNTDPGQEDGDGDGEGDACDTRTPLILSTIPEEGATGVARDATIRVRFTERIQDTTVNADTFVVLGDGHAIEGTRTVDGMTAVFQPAGPLPSATDFTVALGAGLTDLHGLPLAPKFLHFRTAAPDDVTPPQVVMRMPAPDATGVALNAQIGLGFDEPLERRSVTTSTFFLADEDGAVVPANLAVDQGRTLLLTPLAPLSEGREYTVHATTEIRDLAGNRLEEEETWSFLTEDHTPPTDVAISPGDGAKVEAATAVIQVTFDEPMSAQNVTWHVSTDGVPVPGTASVAGAVVRFEPTRALRQNDFYDVTLVTAQDRSGNAIAAPISWSFATLPPPDFTAPTFVMGDPAAGSENATASRPVYVLFSEDIDPASVTSTTFGVSIGGTPVAGTVAVPGSLISLTPDAPLPFGKLVDVHVGAVKDRAGNVLANPTDYSFRVECAPCGQYETCGGGGTPGVCGCVDDQTDAQFCAAHAKTCGSYTTTGKCGNQRTADCGGCNAPESCNTSNVCACIAETDDELCSRNVRECGSLTTTDRCGASRTIACGGAAGAYCNGLADTCGGAGDPLSCGVIPPVLEYPAVTFDRLTNVKGLPSGEAWAVGEAGTVVRWNGSTWTNMRAPTSAVLNDVLPFSPGDLWVAGEAGRVWHWNGSAWENRSAGLPNLKLWGIWGTSSANVWVVGAESFLAHWDGTLWHVVNRSSFGPQYLAIAGSAADDIWITGDQGTFLHATTATASTPADFQPVAAGVPQLAVTRVQVRSPTSAFATDGYNVYSWDGVAWSTVAGKPPSPFFQGIWASGPTEFWAVGKDSPSGSGASAYHYQDGTWTNITPSGLVQYQTAAAVWGVSRTDVTAVGAEGLRLRGNGTSWPAAGIQPQSLYAISSSGTSWFAGGKDGTTVTSIGGTVTLRDAVGSGFPLTENVPSIFAVSPTEAWAGGQQGTNRHFSGTSWGPANTFGQNVTQFFGVAPNDVWSVSVVTGGTRNWNGSAWSAATTPFYTAVPPIVRQLWGPASNEVYALVDDGKLWRWNGSAWSLAKDFGPGTTAYGVTGTSSNDIWVGGNAVWHFDGTAWTKLTLPAGFPPYLQSIATTGPGELWTTAVSGAGSETVWHLKGGTWRQLWSGNRAGTYLFVAPAPGGGVHVAGNTGYLGFGGGVHLVTDPN